MNIKKSKSKIKKIAFILSTIITINSLSTFVSALNCETVALDDKTIADELIENLTSYNNSCLQLDAQLEMGIINQTQHDQETNKMYALIDQTQAALKDFNVDNAEDDIDKMASILASDAINKDDGKVSTYALISGATYCKEILKTLNQSYDVYGSQYTYNDGNKIYDLYNIRVVYSAEKYNSSNTHLGVVKTKVFNDSFSANSEGARKWINEIVNVYSSKFVSGAMDMIPGMKFLPYELLFSSKPSPSSISSNGNAFSVALNTTTTIVFTYVGDTAKNSWQHVLTENMVSYAITYNSFMHINGISKNESKIIKNKIKYSDNYTSMPQTAVKVYNEMKKTNRTTISNGCVKSMAVKGSATKSEVKIEIAHPDYPMGLV
jgi:hypothetical protein